MCESIETIEAQGQDGSFRFESFASLIQPKSAGEFFDDYWETTPFLVKRNIPGFFDSLLRLADVDDYLGTRAFHKPDIRIVKEGKDTRFEDYAKDGIADRTKVLREFRGGAMLLLSHLNRHHLTLAELVSRCEAETHVPMRSNVYLSPPGSRGFKLHWDTHDVLVLQISGSKRWHIHDNPLELPHEEHKRDFKKWVGKANKLAEVELRPGSVLFLPRGFVHGAESGSEHSLHVTFGLRSLTMADIVLGEFRRRSLLDIDMRKVALLDDFADQENLERARAVLRRVVEDMDIEQAIHDVHESFIRSRQPPARGALLDITCAAPLDHDRPLRRRPDALFKVFRDADTVRLAVDGTVVRLPVGVEPAIDHAIEQRQFTPRALPGLEHESKLILARTLLDCRFVEYVK